MSTNNVRVQEWATIIVQQTLNFETPDVSNPYVQIWELKQNIYEE